MAMTDRAPSKADVDAILAHRDKALSLGSIDAEISKAQKDVAALNIEKGKATAAVAALAKEQTARQAQLVALGDEAQRLIAIRSEGERAVADIKMRLGAR
jgi:hypothetical protein